MLALRISCSNTFIHQTTREFKQYETSDKLQTTLTLIRMSNVAS